MDSDQQNTENPDQGITSSDDQQATSQARPYECTFCKRGFSNAQALGGHMNIHRKDKAKLRQITSSLNDHQLQQQYLEIPMMPHSYSPSMEAKSSEERSVNIRWPWINLGDKEGIDATKRSDEIHRSVAEMKQLPLFVDKQFTEDQKPSRTEQGSSSPSHDSLRSELDLELRLGPEPHQDSSAGATGTKKFF